MKNFFKHASALSLLMLILCAIALVSFIFSKNIYAAIWTINTALWVIVSIINEMRLDDLQESNGKLTKECNDLWAENEELKNNKE